MPPEVIDKIFNPFFTTKPTNQGTGLGLSISSDIIRRHGGQIQVESEPGILHRDGHHPPGGTAPGS